MEKKKPELAAQKDCLGCHACEAVCPTRSISFTGDGFFKYPVVDEETCINCGKCEKACNNVRSGFLESDKDFEQRFFCAYNLDAEERLKATSGGVGGALAKAALSQGWLVCGAAFDDNMHLHHILSDDASILEKIRGSKYLQSDVTGVFEQIRDAVKEKRKVLFVGTPCQCQALVASLPVVMRSSVITCAIICHGVNSAKVWEDYVHYLENKSGRKLLSYNFRSKDKGWGAYRSAIQFQGKKVNCQPAWKDVFMVWFGMDTILQPSCFHCPYRRAERYADITIGDFWGIEKVLPDLPVADGASVLIASTPQGYKFIENTQNLFLQEVDANLTVSKALKGFIEKRSEEKIAIKEKNRITFEKEYIQKGFCAMSKLYPAQNTFQRMWHHIRFVLRRKGIRI